MKKKTIHMLIILIIFLLTGCNDIENFETEFENINVILEQYKENEDFSGFIPEKVQLDLYTTNWLYKLNLDLNEKILVNEKELKEFLVSMDVTNTTENEEYNSTKVPNIIYTLSYLELASSLDVHVNNETKNKIIDYLISRQDPNSGYFKSDTEEMNDALFTTFSIEILNILEQEILHKDKLIRTINEENKSEIYLLQILFLLNEDIPKDLAKKVEEMYLEVGSIDNIIDLNLAYIVKNSLLYAAPNTISIPWEQMKEPKVLYQISDLINGNFPSDVKVRVMDLLNNQKSEIGWGTESEFSIFSTYLGLNILKSIDSLDYINLSKVASFLSAKVNEFHIISTVNKEKLNYNDLINLQYIVKLIKDSDFLEKEIKEILEVQIELYEKEDFSTPIGILIESSVLSGNEALLNQFNNNLNLTNIESIYKLEDLYSYTLQSYISGEISKDNKNKILNKLETFDSGGVFFYSTELKSESSIEGLYQAYTIVSLLESELPNQENILKNIENHISTEKNFNLLGLLSVLRNDLTDNIISFKE